MKLAFIGDVMLGRLVNESLKKEPPEHPWGDTLKVLQKATLRICNLECAVTDHDEPLKDYPKISHFRTDLKNSAVLKAARIDAVSLANNHVLDFGYAGLKDTFSVLDRSGIDYFGAGENIAKAAEARVISKNGLKIGFIAFSDNEPGWEADKKSPGIFYSPLDAEDLRIGSLLKIIREAKKKVDFLVVSAHWGDNWGYTPPLSHIQTAHAFIENGADVIFGHSPHVFRGIEIYDNKPIIYSAGDFMDDYAVNDIERNNESFIFMIETENASIRSIKLFPVIIDSLRASLAQGKQAEEISRKMEWLSGFMGTESVWNAEESCLEIAIGNSLE